MNQTLRQNHPLSTQNRSDVGVAVIVALLPASDALGGGLSA
jgi:hypothetical protein